MASYSRGVSSRRGIVALVGVVLIVAVVIWLATSLFSCATQPVEDAGVEDIALDDRSVEDIVYDAVYPGDELLESVGISFPAFRYTDNIEVVYQYPDYPSGCEIAALTCVLNSMGYDVSLTQMIEGDYVSYYPSWTGAASEYYFGTPYGQGGAFPPAIVNAANRFLDEQSNQVQAEEHVEVREDGQAYVEGEEHLEGQGAQVTSAQTSSDVRAEELDGASSDELLMLVELGYPVLVWVTISYDAPAFSGQYIDDYAWYTNEHCVVLYGYDEAADEVLISDSISGYVNMSAESFFDLYEACGAYSVVIR